MNWTNKTSPVKEIKYEEDEVDMDEAEEKPFDELDWELKKFQQEKEEFQKKLKQQQQDDDEEEEEEEEETDEQILEKIRNPPYSKQMAKEFDEY